MCGAHANNGPHPHIKVSEPHFFVRLTLWVPLFICQSNGCFHSMWAHAQKWGHDHAGFWLGYLSIPSLWKWTTKEKNSGGPFARSCGTHHYIFTLSIHPPIGFWVGLCNELGPSNSMAKWVLTIDLDPFFSIGPYFVCVINWYFYLF